LRKARSLLRRTEARGRLGWIQLGVTANLLAFDQVSKWAIRRNIPLDGRVAVIPGCFQLTHVENRGGAFGLWAQSKFLWMPEAVIVFSIVVLTVLAVLQWRIWKTGRKEYATSVALSLIAGGAAGNSLNRIFLGRVVNFLDFYFGRHHWPAFNLADAAIVIGAILLLYEIAIGGISTRNTSTQKKAAGA
jgi:signal peptidase II